MRGVIFLPVFANSIAPNLIFGQTIIEDGKKWKENSIWNPPNQIGQLNNALAGLTQKAAFSPAEDWLCSWKGLDFWLSPKLFCPPLQTSCQDFLLPFLPRTSSMILCSFSCPTLWLLFTAAALFHQLTEAEIAFAVLLTSSVGGSWSLVDTHGSTSSTGGQDQPRPLHCFQCFQCLQCFQYFQCQCLKSLQCSSTDKTSPAQSRKETIGCWENFSDFWINFRLGKAPKKNWNYLGLFPKQRTPPTHPPLRGLGLSENWPVFQIFMTKK